VNAALIADNLPEIVKPLLAPMFERFSFYQLPMAMVVEELTRMKESRL
jgi:hypothetical protein